jgi:hypothetical protein
MTDDNVVSDTISFQLWIRLLCKYRNFKLTKPENIVSLGKLLIEFCERSIFLKFLNIYRYIISCKPSLFPCRYAIVRLSQRESIFKQLDNSLFLNEITLISSRESQSVNCSKRFSVTSDSLVLFCIKLGSIGSDAS